MTGTATAAATSSVTAAAGSTAAVTRPVLTRSCFIDRHFAPVPVGAVKSVDGGVSAFFGFHRHKGEPPRLAADFVHHHGNIGDCSMFGEGVPQIVFADVKRKITDIYFCVHRFIKAGWSKAGRRIGLEPADASPK
jgi:hypothetical protein